MVLATFVPLGLPARAQDATPGGELAGRGYPLGQFHFLPSVTFENFYNDNIFASENDETDDYFVSITSADSRDVLLSIPAVPCACAPESGAAELPAEPRVSGSTAISRTNVSCPRLPEPRTAATPPRSPSARTRRVRRN